MICKQDFGNVLCLCTTMHTIIHIQHYRRLAIKRLRISFPIIPSKLLQLADWPLASPSSFEGIIGTEVGACLMVSLRCGNAGCAFIQFSHILLHKFQCHFVTGPMMVNVGHQHIINCSEFFFIVVRQPAMARGKQRSGPETRRLGTRTTSSIIFIIQCSLDIILYYITNRLLQHDVQPSFFGAFLED